MSIVGSVSQSKLSKFIKIADAAVYALILLVTFYFVQGLDYGNTDLSVVLSFFAIGLYSFISIAKPGRCMSIYKIVFMFNYIFYFMAGLQCYCWGKVLWLDSGMLITYTSADYLKTNIMILVMSACFDFMYTAVKKRHLKHPRNATKKESSFDQSLLMSKFSMNCLLALCAISFLILLFTGNITKETPMFANESVSAQIPKMLRYIPVCSLIMFIACKKKPETRHDKIFLIAVGVEILVFFFPLAGFLPRFFVLGTYIVILALLFSDFKCKSFFWAGIFFGFCFLFSDLRSFKNLATLNIKIDFAHVDFDAHQLLMNCVKHTDIYGVCGGLNFLSAFAFLLPRSIWTGKMVSTGIIVTQSFYSRQGNVSSPLVGEAYFALSWFGVVLIGFILGGVIYMFDSWFDSDNGLKRGVYCIIAGMTVYILRGSLLSTMSFTLALILTLACTYVFLFVIRKAYDKNCFGIKNL